MAEFPKPENKNKPILQPSNKENLYESLNSLSFTQSFTLLINHYKRDAITTKPPTRTKGENR
ncbi:hypothetical protein ACLVWU_10395 [Bdellovibrio sp. HCB290]|uniref:hypothetical protein n=1 Tax=Bdellovibrio sp. HCB290 TaxID=3394356 RepID=UPI0039B562BD